MFGSTTSLTEIALFLLAVLVVAVVAMAIIGPAVTEIIADLPLSKHAEQAHDGQPNAGSIARRIDQGKCDRVGAYVCPFEKTVKVLCEVGGCTEAVVIGIENPGSFLLTLKNPHLTVVVTGYRARCNYWNQNVKGCVGIPLDTLPDLLPLWID